MPAFTMPTPTGAISVTEQDGVIAEIRWLRRLAEGGDHTPLLAAARRQLKEYFARKRQHFDLPLRQQGSPLQLAVWRAMQAIPYGQTRTYGEIAAEVDSNARAVGAVCGTNPLPIVVPCHRIMGAGGRLTGFSGGRGIDTKRALLALEGAMLL